MAAHLPPHSAAPAACDDPRLSQAAVYKLQRHFQYILKLEQMAANGNEDAKFLLKDLSWTQKKCIRLLCLLFERDGWTVFSNAAQRYLRALLYTPWDNKMLEDVHNYLRDLYRQGRANLNSPMSRSNAAIHSKRIEERSITTVHPDRQYFRMHFREMRSQRIRHMFNPRSFKLPKATAKILDERNWASPNSEGLRTGVAGWFWLEFYFEELTEAMRQRISIRDAWVTKVGRSRLN